MCGATPLTIAVLRTWNNAGGAPRATPAIIHVGPPAPDAYAILDASRIIIAPVVIADTAIIRMSRASPVAHAILSTGAQAGRSPDASSTVIEIGRTAPDSEAILVASQIIVQWIAIAEITIIVIGRPTPDSITILNACAVPCRAANTYSTVIGVGRTTPITRTVLRARAVVIAGIRITNTAIISSR